MRYAYVIGLVTIMLALSGCGSLGFQTSALEFAIGSEGFTCKKGSGGVKVESPNAAAPSLFWNLAQSAPDLNSRTARLIQLMQACKKFLKPTF